jgi:hypothetical protein
MTFAISPPSNINNMFGNWLNGITKKDKGCIRIGVCALLWAIWKVRNDFIFNKTTFPSFLQVIPLTMHWIHMRSFLQPEEERLAMNIGCNRMATVARDSYSRCGWRCDRRLAC